MGAGAMTGFDQQAPKLDIQDPKVCRSYLVGNCPHDLFTNTKQDFGPCPKVHNEALKTEYQEASETQKRIWNFEWDYFIDMQKYVRQCDARIKDAQGRLEKTVDEIRLSNQYVSRPKPMHKHNVETDMSSSTPSRNSTSPSKPACSKSRSWARRAWSIWLFRSSTRSA